VIRKQSAQALPVHADRNPAQRLGPVYSGRGWVTRCSAPLRGPPLSPGAISRKASLIPLSPIRVPCRRQRRPYTVPPGALSARLLLFTGNRDAIADRRHPRRAGPARGCQTRRGRSLSWPSLATCRRCVNHGDQIGLHFAIRASSRPRRADRMHLKDGGGLCASRWFVGIGGPDLAGPRFEAEPRSACCSEKISLDSTAIRAIAPHCTGAPCHCRLPIAPAHPHPRSMWVRMKSPSPTG